MSKKPNLYLVNSDFSVQYDHEYVRFMAKSLCLRFNVHYGTEFVLLLGDGSENNNRHAVEAWVRRSLEDHYERSPQKVFEYLAAKLAQELENWDSNRWG
jgi:hypothetical protein